MNIRQVSGQEDREVLPHIGHAPLNSPSFSKLHSRLEELCCTIAYSGIKPNLPSKPSKVFKNHFPKSTKEPVFSVLACCCVDSSYPLSI